MTLRPALVTDGDTVRVDVPVHRPTCHICGTLFRQATEASTGFDAPVAFSLPGGGTAVVSVVVCGAHRAHRLHLRDGRGEVTVTASKHVAHGEATTLPGVLAAIFSHALREPLADLAPLLDVATACRTLAARHGGRPVSANDLAWELTGWTPAQRAAGEAGRMDGDAALRWKHTKGLSQFTPAEAAAWYPAVGTDYEAAAWFRLAGIRNPEDRPEGLEAAEVQILRMAGVDLTSDWANDGYGLCPDFIRAAVAPGRSPRDIVTVARELTDQPRGGEQCGHPTEGKRVHCGWVQAESAEATLRARQWADLDWSILANGLRAGMTLDEAADYARSGGDPAAVALLAGLTP